MDGFVKGRSAGHSGVWWKGSYLQIKSGEKLSEKVLWDVCIPLRDLYLFSHKAVFEHCSCKTEKVTFCSALKTRAKSDIYWNKTQKEGFQEIALWRVHSFQRLKFTLRCPVWKLCLWRICEGILSGAWRLVVRKEMPSDENWTESFRVSAL